MSEARAPHESAARPAALAAWRTMLGGLEGQVETLALQVEKLRLQLVELGEQSDAVLMAIEMHDGEYAAAGGAAAETPTDDAHAVSQEEREREREEIRRQVEQLRAEFAPEDGAADDNEANSVAFEAAEASDREAEAVTVWEGQPGAATERDAADEELDEREQVRRAVEQVRAEMTGELAPAAEDKAATTTDKDESAPADSDDARREEVRRAVERAKAALAGATADDTPKEISRWPAMQDTGLTPPPQERRGSGAPVIVIDDPEGRVELVQVYQVLSRVGSAGTAVLMNYTHHNVTIGINSFDLPETEQVVTAVQGVFGRACSPQLEGSKLTLRIGSERISAA